MENGRSKFIEVPVLLFDNADDEDDDIDYENLGITVKREIVTDLVLLNVSSIERVNPMVNGRDYKAVIWVDSDHSYRTPLTYDEVKRLILKP